MLYFCRGLPPKEREILELNFFCLGLKIMLSRSPNIPHVVYCVGVTADLDLPRIWIPRSKSAGGCGPPIRRFGPPYQTFLLSIFSIIFGN